MKISKFVKLDGQPQINPDTPNLDNSSEQLNLQNFQKHIKTAKIHKIVHLKKT